MVAQAIYPFALSFLLPVIMHNLTVERETMLLDYMLIMGTPPSSLSWEMLCVCVACVSLRVANSPLSPSGFMWVDELRDAAQILCAHSLCAQLHCIHGRGRCVSRDGRRHPGTAVPPLFPSVVERSC